MNTRTVALPPAAVLDSDVLIDLSRQHPPAVIWFVRQPDVLAVSGFAALELLAGCRSNADTVTAQAVLGALPILWLPEAALQAALTWYAPLPPARGVGVLDALIAATALAHGLPLFTFNVKHFTAVPGLVTRQPYQR